MGTPASSNRRTSARKLSRKTLHCRVAFRLRLVEHQPRLGIHLAREPEALGDVVLAERRQKNARAQIAGQPVPRSYRLVYDIPVFDAAGVALHHRFDVRLEQMLRLVRTKPIDPIGKRVVPDQRVSTHGKPFASAKLMNWSAGANSIVSAVGRSEASLNSSSLVRMRQSLL